MKTDRVVPSPFLPSPLFSAVVPENRIVRIVLGILAVIVVVRVVLSLLNGRVQPPANTPEQVNEAAKECFRKGLSHLQNNRKDEALAEFSNGYALNPQDPVVRAPLCIQIGRLISGVDQAIEKVEEVFTLNLTDVELLKQAHHDRAMSAEWQKDYTTALNHYQWVVDSEADLLQKSLFQLMIAIVHCKKGEFDVAQTKSQEVIDRKFKVDYVANLLTKIALLFAENKQYEQAHIYFEHAFEASPDANRTATIHYYLAGVYESQKEYVACWEQLTCALENEKSINQDFRGEILFRRATVRHQIPTAAGFPADKKWDDVFADYTAALHSISGDNFRFKAELLYSRALLYRQLGQEINAVADLQEALRCPTLTTEFQDKIRAALK